MMQQFFAGLEWWHWVVFGSILLSIDIFVLNIYFLTFFGGAALMVALALFFFPLSSAMQMGLWGIFSVILVLAWLFAWRPFALARLLRRDVEEVGKLVGISGTVIFAGETGGRIRFQRPVGGRDVWQFRSTERFRAGTRGVVSGIDVESGQLIVVPPEENSGAK